MKAKNIIRIVLVTAGLLLIPLLGRWPWTLSDFVIIGTLLLGSGLIYELVTSKVNAKYRPAIAVVIVAVVLLIWIELAVGLFGSPFAGS